MPSPFDLNASIRFQAKDLDKIQKEINRFSAPRVDIGRTALAGANAEYLQMYKNVRRVRSGIEELGNVVGTAARRFGGISVATGTFLGLARGIKNSVGEAITFEREMIKVAQATDNAVNSTETLRKTIMNVGETYGASGVELAKYSRILAQAGFSAKQTQGAIKLLAKADLTGTFGGISENVEGMIAIMQQFGKEAAKSGKEIEFLEKAYDSISRVSKKYAVESGDIIDAVKKAGGVFATAGGSLEEFIAILTSVRATTRESADVIANGLKTIAVRLQDTDNVKALQKLGIQLEDTKGNFVGVFSAVQRLSEGLKGLDPKSIRFANIVKELGGVYQIGRFITLIQEAKLSQEALNDALTAGGDINRDVAKQQQSLGFQIDKLAQRFSNLVLEITKTSTFKEFTGIFMEIADALLNVGNTLKDNLPLFKTFFALLGGRAAQYAFQSWAGMSKPLSTKVPISNPVPSEGFSGTRAFQSGGHVTSRKGDQKSDRDSLKAILQPGEYVLRKKAVETIGVNTLNMMNQGLLKTVDIATQRKASFSNRTSPQKGYTGTVAQILQKTKLKSLESLYDIDNPADMFIAPAINRTPLRYADGSKVRYNDLKMQAGGITKQAAAEFSKSGPKAANNFLSSIDLGGYVDKVSNKTFSSSGDIFKLFTSVQGAIAEKIFQKANPSYQKLPNAFGMDMISTDGKFAEIKATSTRMSPHTMIGKALIALARFANPKSGYKNKQRDVIGIPETTFYDTALRFNTGGIVPGSGSGDKIPALLEPGEVVVNKRAAKNVGYDVFNAMNRGSISMLADGTQYKNEFWRKRNPKPVSEFVGTIQGGGGNSEVIKAEKELLLKIADAVGDWTKVGLLFKEAVGKMPSAKALSQFGQASSAKQFENPLMSGGVKSFIDPKIEAEQGFSNAVLAAITDRKSISEADKKLAGINVGDVAQTTASTQTTQAVIDNGKATVEAINEVAKNTAETAKTAPANAKASKEAQVSSGIPKGLQDIISSKKITPETNKVIAKNVITRQAKEAGFSEEEIAKAIQNTPELQDGAAGQAPMRKINLKPSGLLEKETKAINDLDKKEVERYKAEQEAAGQISPEKSKTKSPYPPEEEKLRKEIMAEAIKLRDDPTVSKGSRFENIMDRAKTNVLARREQEAKAQAEAKAREEAASTVEVPDTRSSAKTETASAGAPSPSTSGTGGIPPTPPVPPVTATVPPEDDGKKKSSKRRKKKSVGAEETVPPVAEAAAKAESSQIKDDSIDLGMGVRMIPRKTATGDMSPIQFAFGREFVDLKDEQDRRSTFYRSSMGTGGKTQGQWYPTGGPSENAYGDEWIIKGDSVNDPAYGRPDLQKLYEKANQVLPHTDSDMDAFINKHLKTDMGAKAINAPQYQRKVFKTDLTNPGEILNYWKQQYLNPVWGPRVESGASASTGGSGTVPPIPPNVTIGAIPPDDSDKNKSKKKEGKKQRLPADGVQKVIQPSNVITSEMASYIEASDATQGNIPMISPVSQVKNRQKLNKATSQASSVLSIESLKALQETSELDKNLKPRTTIPNVDPNKLKSSGKNISSDLLNVIEAETASMGKTQPKLKPKTQAVQGMVSPETFQDLIDTRNLPKNPKINNTLMDLLVANGVATAMPAETRIPTAGKVQPMSKATAQAVSVTSPQMLKELQKSKTESENRQASGKIISGLLGQYGVKPQQNFDPSWMEGSPRADLRKVARGSKAKELLASGMSQEDVNKWFASEENKETIKKDVRTLRRGTLNARDFGSYAQSSIDPKQAAAMKEKAQAEIEYKNKSFFGKVASKFPATKYLKYTGLGFGRGGSGNGAGGGVSGASGGPNDPNNSAKNLANGLDEAADKASGFGSAMGPLPLVIGMLVTNSELFTGALKSITGASDQQVKSIQDSIAAMTAFYFTFQQLNSIMKSSVPKIDAQGNILGDDGKALEIEGPDGKATKVQAKGIKGKIARGARFAASKGLTFGNLALAGAAAAGTSNYLASQKTQEAQKKQGLISKDLEKVSVGGNISLEELQKRSREAYGLQDKANRGRSMGFFSGLPTGIGGAYAGATAGAALGSVVPVLGTAVGGAIGGAAGAILGGAVGAGVGSAASDYMYKQPTLDEKSIDASVKAQYVAAKSSYNFGKTIDKLRSGTLKTEDANKLASQGAIDAASSLDQTRAAAMTANVALKDAEDQTSTFAGWLWTSTKDIDAFRERVSKSEEALAQSREVAKQARSTQADQFNANLTERLSKASTSSEIDNILNSIRGEGPDQTFTNMLDALESATAAASDEPDRAKAQIAASEDRAARQEAAIRTGEARQFEVEKINAAIAVRTAEITLMQQFNNAMKSVTSQTLSMQDAQSKVSVLRGESGGGFNTDRLRDISQVGDIGAFKNTANSLASLVPGGAALAQKATTAGSASDQFRNLTTTSGLFTGLNELRKVIKPGVDASKTRMDISNEISKNIPEFSSLDTVIQDQVINKLYENLSEGNLELSQIADIGKVISDSGQKFADVLIAAGENANNFVEQLRGVNAALIEEQNKLIQLRSGSIDIRSRGMERMASVSTLMPSQKAQLEANREAFRQAKDAQMLGDVGLRSGSAGQLGQSLTGINAQIQANKQQLSDPNLDVKKRANLNLANQGLESQANALTTVLGRLTDQSDRASDKMEQISRIQVQKELVKNRVESFAFGTTEQKFAMAEQAAGLQQVMRTGNFNVLPDDLKGQVSDFMKQLAEANPEGAVGKMFRKIQVDAVRQQQAMGLIGDQEAQAAIDIVEGKDVAAEKKLKQELADINKQELIAQQALIDAQREVTKSYLEMVNVIKQGFVNPAAGGQQQPQAVPNAPVMAPNAVPIFQPQNAVAVPGNAVAQAAPSFEPVITSMRSFTDTLQKISDSFSNMTMTHTLNIDGQINIAGVNTDSIATQLRDSLGEYIGQIVTEEFSKRNSSFRTA
jgi:TP901 family phage tail tape measure protein